MPCRSRRPDHGAGDEARARHLRRLRSPAPSQCVAARPERQVDLVTQLLEGGLDSGEIIIRGGSHLDFSWIPNQAFGASLRGPDIIDWYTSAWFDKYLKRSPRANRRLLSDRWQHDPVEAAIDPNHDGNGFSFYYYSRLDIRLANGSRWDCEDHRDGCAGMVPQAYDSYPGNYSYIAIDTSTDAMSGPGRSLRPTGRHGS